jgi:hypothetical protein
MLVLLSTGMKCQIMTWTRLISRVLLPDFKLQRLLHRGRECNCIAPLFVGYFPVFFFCLPLHFTELDLLIYVNFIRVDFIIFKTPPGVM